MIIARAQAKFDQSARVGRRLVLPSLIGLVALHRPLSRTIPGPGRFAAQVMFADQRFLYLARAIGIDHLLPAFLRAFRRFLASRRMHG